MLGTYLEWQVEDPNWRLGENQCLEVQEYKNTIKRRES